MQVGEVQGSNVRMFEFFLAPVVSCPGEHTYCYVCHRLRTRKKKHFPLSACELFS